MCLTSVQKIFSENDRMVVGYKVYKKISEKVYKEKFQHNRRIEGIHYKAYGFRIQSDKGDFYGAGFHVYSSKKEAFGHCYSTCYSNQKVCKVLAWDIRAIGRETEIDKSRVYVAKNIRIMEEITK